jgi:hypothetical protein
LRVRDRSSLFNVNGASVFLKPRWYSVLPEHIRPPEDKLEALETLRLTLKMRDDGFLAAIASGPWAIVRSQEVTLDTLRRQFPEADERRLWTAVLIARLEVKLNSPAPWDPPEEEIRRRMETIVEIVRPMTSWQEVLAYVLEMDRDGINPDPLGPHMQIEKILAS